LVYYYKIYKKLEKNKDNNYLDYLLLSFYVLIQPRRNDISKLFYGNSNLIDYDKDNIMNININYDNINNIDSNNYNNFELDKYIDNANENNTIIVNIGKKGLKQKLCNQILDIKCNQIIYIGCDKKYINKDYDILIKKYTMTYMKSYDVFYNNYNMVYLMVFSL
jgi:hypothetical protein